MKKLILSLTVVAFAVAVQAGDAKTCPANADKPACCAAAAEKPCCAKGNAEQTKANTKSKASKTASKPLPSPKAMSLAKN